jgi:hypothetical protein
MKKQSKEQLSSPKDTRGVYDMDIEDQIELACEWIKSLASNEYSQQRGSMHQDYDLHINRDAEYTDCSPSGKMCCLGVLRSMAHPTLPEPDSEYEKFEYDTSEPDTWERLWYGIRNEGIIKLVEFNDADYDSFPTIARRILTDADAIYEKAVADGIKEYFFDAT